MEIYVRGEDVRIKELKENVSIPVIGNGDVKNIDDINKFL